ncbi:hypothetical protein EXIGLDRAFT_139406 [Exidia glandulosa HHB12029]|uniref:Uncharacterized protein n=1 Tax=Exidia glandulosa HHB12029 TaxID=1314781 RepID=A0A166A973_EXIGL|nr:hypothetical protein EXIGLDRAFT_139392 [Exidia glandulosa HHB12029]KZV89710.1 hypothetical protein EXIGLDRAFT_139406 [Exidia glandulosa HHB12029]
MRDVEPELREMSQGPRLFLPIVVANIHRFTRIICLLDQKKSNGDEQWASNPSDASHGQAQDRFEMSSDVSGPLSKRSQRRSKTRYRSRKCIEDR